MMLKALAILVLAAAVAGAASAGSRTAGSWSTIPAAPLPVTGVAGWTGTDLVVFGRRSAASLDRLEAYDPAARAWRLLAPPPKTDNYCRRDAAWTGRELLVWGCAQLAFDPRTGRWRRLPPAPTSQGVVVWTGRELVGWGGGCCGDVGYGGSAFDVSAGTWRTLPHAPLAPAQRPLGVWTGREVVLLVSGFDPEGKPYPARLARAAAYNPATNRWRRLAPLPERALRFASAAVWTGREVVVAAAGAGSRSNYGLDPETNRWRRLAPLPAPRAGASAFWTGSRLLVWGGQNLRATRGLRNGVALDPRTGRWSTIPSAPLRRVASVAAWAGTRLFVFGGREGATRSLSR